MATLEHLTLYHDRPFGFYPKLELSDIHFPRLKSLALGNYSFFHDDQINWILSHASTLRELYLDRCSILYLMKSDYEEDKKSYHPSAVDGKWDPVEIAGTRHSIHTYPGQWNEYFTLFRTRLPQLRHFRFGESVWGDPEELPLLPFEKEQDIEIALLDNRYMVFDGRSGYMMVDNAAWLDGLIEVLIGLEEDMAALGDLLQKTGQCVGEPKWVAHRHRSDGPNGMVLVENDLDDSESDSESGSESGSEPAPAPASGPEPEPDPDSELAPEFDLYSDSVNEFFLESDSE